MHIHTAQSITVLVFTSLLSSWLFTVAVTVTVIITFIVGETVRFHAVYGWWEPQPGVWFFFFGFLFDRDRKSIGSPLNSRRRRSV